MFDGLGFMVGIFGAVLVRFRGRVIGVDHRAQRRPSSLVAHVRDAEVSSGGQGYERGIDDGLWGLVARRELASADAASSMGVLGRELPGGVAEWSAREVAGGEDGYDEEG